MSGCDSLLLSIVRGERRAPEGWPSLPYGHVTMWSTRYCYITSKRWVMGSNPTDFIFPLFPREKKGKRICDRTRWRRKLL